MWAIIKCVNMSSFGFKHCVQSLIDNIDSSNRKVASSDTTLVGYNNNLESIFTHNLYRRCRSRKQHQFFRICDVPRIEINSAVAIKNKRFAHFSLYILRSIDRIVFSKIVLNIIQNTFL